MKVTIDGTKCIVEREKGDRRIYQTEWAWGESILLHRVKQELIAQGYDLIKKRMWKDGHLTDDNRFYLRTRSHKSPRPHIYIYDPLYHLRLSHEDFSVGGSVELEVVYDIFEGD